MIVKLTTKEAGGHYTVIEMTHPPCVGPALHVHPAAIESFYILAGVYTFYKGAEVIEARRGDCICIPPGVPHRYKVGFEGGQAIVISPPFLEHYFETISKMLLSGPITAEIEKDIASRYGQHFLDMTGHWSQ
jgi:quercetin dioxygenase-like cupin family protein